MSSDSAITRDAGRWPLPDERAPFAQATRRTRRWKPPRSAWLLTSAAFLCGGLVSAAGFSIGWRHQAQRDTAARTALAAATSRINQLSTSLTTARRTVAQERQADARATASLRATTRAAASLSTEAGASGRAANAVSASAGDIGATATRVTRELQTLLTYLTTTPAGQIDSGYVASQAAYLTRQLTALQDSGAGESTAVTSLDTALRKLSRKATALAHR